MGNISNTYIGVKTWRRAEGFHMNDWLNGGAWEKQSTYSHNRMPFSNADRKSLLPNFFLVAAWKKRGYKHSEQKQREGLGEQGRQGGVCMWVVGWRRKVGCGEQ